MEESELRSQLALNQMNTLMRFTGGDGLIMQSLDGKWLTFYINNRLVGLTELTGDLLDDIDRLHDWLCWLFRNSGHILNGGVLPGIRPEA